MNALTEKTHGLPEIYALAEWRCVTRVNPETQRLGLGFDCANGAIVRLSISRESAQSILASLQHYLDLDHALSSSGNPHSDGSIPLEGQ